MAACAGASLPSLAELDALRARDRRHGVRQESSVEPYREVVAQLLEQKVTAQVILARLQERGYAGSYSSVRRFVQKLRGAEPKAACVRMEVAAGEEAQVDFGSAGWLYDAVRGKEVKAWAFVMTLSHSRHQYVEIVADQKVETRLRLHRHAFAFFGGVPRRIVLDNLKAGIVKAALHDPIVQRAYSELAEHYGFLIAPCRPGTPEHKGKVERGGVSYVKGNFLAGRTFASVQHANAQVPVWVRDTAGIRIHGTTQQRPLEVFERVEQAALQPLPDEPFVLCGYQQAKLHPDCHVVFGLSYYSAPHRLIGEELLLRVLDHQVGSTMDTSL